MDTYPINVNTKLVAVYYNTGKPNQFRVDVDVTLSNLKEQLDQINSRINHKDTRTRRMNNFLGWYNGQQRPSYQL